MTQRVLSGVAEATVATSDKNSSKRNKEVKSTKRKRHTDKLFAAKSRSKPKLPGFEARIRETYGSRVLAKTGAEQIARDRERL